MDGIRILKTRKSAWIAAVLLLAAIAAAFAPDEATAGSSEDLIPFLNQTIVWSRQLSAQQQLVTEPSDALFLNDSRQIADQVVKLSFDFARARAQALTAQPGSGTNGGKQAPSQYQRLIDSVV